MCNEVTIQAFVTPVIGEQRQEMKKEAVGFLLTMPPIGITLLLTMRIIKRAVLIFIAIVLAFSLAACGKEEVPATTPEAEETPTPRPEQSATIIW
jgi:predicted small lipoprotein YifL